MSSINFRLLNAGAYRLSTDIPRREVLLSHDPGPTNFFGAVWLTEPGSVAADPRDRTMAKVKERLDWTQTGERPNFDFLFNRLITDEGEHTLAIK